MREARNIKLLNAECKVRFVMITQRHQYWSIRRRGGGGNLFSNREIIKQTKTTLETELKVELLIAN